jgi:hypothetical protein
LGVVLSLVTTAWAHAVGSLSEGVADGPTSPADAILGAWASPERESVRADHGYVGVVVSAKSSALVGKQLFRSVTWLRSPPSSKLETRSVAARPRR